MVELLQHRLSEILLEDSLRAMGVEPRKDQIEKELKWQDTPMVEVPDLVGITKNEIRELMLI